MMWSDRNSHPLLIGMQNGTVTLEGILAVSYETKYTLTYDLASGLLGSYSKELGSLCEHRNLHMDVYSSFIHKC